MAGSCSSRMQFDPATPFHVAVEHQDQIDTRDSRDMSFNGDLTFALGADRTLRSDVFYLNTDREETEDGDQLFPRRRFHRGSAHRRRRRRCVRRSMVRQRDVPSEPGHYTGQLRHLRALRGLAGGPLVVRKPSSAMHAFSKTTLRTTSRPRCSMAIPKKASAPRSTADDQEISFDGCAEFQFRRIRRNMGMSELRIRNRRGGQAEDARPTPARVRRRQRSRLRRSGRRSVTPGSSGLFDLRRTPLRRLRTELRSALRRTLRCRSACGWRTPKRTPQLSAARAASSDEQQINPSAHLQWNVSENGQIRASVARTVRRPTIDQLVPFADEESPGDDDETVGNPDLGFETAWGYDIGYEHRIGQPRHHRHQLLPPRRRAT